MVTADPAETPTIVSVSDGFYVRQAVDNIAWIDLGEFAVVVDALEQPELEDEVFEAIRSTIDGKEIRFVLNTHTHYDHTALNDAFRREFGSEIVNQQTCRISPDGRRFDGARRSLLMLPMGGCHTSEDCIVWAETDKALFVGDIFGWGLIPAESGLDRRMAARLLETYKRLIDFGASVVVPGHGPVATGAELKRWVEYFNWLIDEVARAVAAGRTDAQIVTETPPPDDMKGWWRFVLWKHSDSLGKVAAAVRAGRLGKTK